MTQKVLYIIFSGLSQNITRCSYLRLGYLLYSSQGERREDKDIYRHWHNSLRKNGDSYEFTWASCHCTTLCWIHNNLLSRTAQSLTLGLLLGDTYNTGWNQSMLLSVILRQIYSQPNGNDCIFRFAHDFYLSLIAIIVANERNNLPIGLCQILTFSSHVHRALRYNTNGFHSAVVEAYYMLRCALTLIASSRKINSAEKAPIHFRPQHLFRELPNLEQDQTLSKAELRKRYWRTPGYIYWKKRCYNFLSSFGLYLIFETTYIRSLKNNCHLATTGYLTHGKPR